MSCEEAYEWMQRDLDGDLNDNEKAILRQHLALCRECASLYQRLSSLSTHLAQLPLVEPPINIVNSILPELDRIDLERAITSPIQEQAAAFEKPRRRTKRAVWYRYIGGVTAAGLLISAVVFTLNNENQPVKQSAFSSPQVKVENTAEKHNKALAEADAQRNTEKRTDEQETDIPSTSQPSVSAEAERKAEASSEQNAKENSEAAPDTKKSQDETKRYVAQAPAEHAQERTSTSGQKDTNEQNTTAASESGKENPPAEEDSASAGNGGASIAQAPDASDSNQHAAMAKESEPSKDNGKTNNTTSALALAKEQAKEGQKPGRPAIASAAQSSTYRPPGKPSPEEQYFVSKVDNRLLVRDANGGIAFITRPWNDMYNVSYRWIDAKRIVYNLEYVGGTGQTDTVPLQSQEWMIDLEKNVERPIYK
ncbi:zf-HC2 domain-containing protein [Aneurinibacillus sp. REN35]|uniref:zf-HC2 domain-containing protein n=1 Tax=Aneurinibacillus sp. REN35 TaxID=3237286 RepID=UPI00352960BD